MNMWVHTHRMHINISRIMVKMWNLDVKFSDHFPYFIYKNGLCYHQGCVHT
jgi:hypothetical protein